MGYIAFCGKINNVYKNPTELEHDMCKPIHLKLKYVVELMN